MTPPNEGVLEPGPFSRRVLLGAALCAVYVIWGSTYWAIAVAVRSIPPLLAAALRLVPAGAVLFAFARASGRTAPPLRHWLGATPLGLLMLGFGNGLVCLAERSVPSGVVAVVIAITPSFVVGIPWLLGGRRPRNMALGGIALGLVGVAVLSWRAGSVQAVDATGLAFVVAACLSWAVALLLAPRLPLPSDPLYASALPMLTGGGSLALASAIHGDLRRVHVGPELWPAAIAIAYLALFGSVVAYTAYLWLQRNASPALATSNVYVNPVIALALGWALNGEPLAPRAIIGSALVLVAVALIGRTDVARSRADSDPSFSPAAVPESGD